MKTFKIEKSDFKYIFIIIILFIFLLAVVLPFAYDVYNPIKNPTCVDVSDTIKCAQVTDSNGQMMTICEYDCMYFNNTVLKSQVRVK